MEDFRIRDRHAELISLHEGVKRFAMQKPMRRLSILRCSSRIGCCGHTQHWGMMRS